MNRFKITFYTNYPQKLEEDYIIETKIEETTETKEELLRHVHVLTAEQLDVEETDEVTDGETSEVIEPEVVKTKGRLPGKGKGEDKK